MTVTASYIRQDGGYQLTYIRQDDGYLSIK
jgi:hypothetical protein